MTKKLWMALLMLLSVSCVNTSKRNYDNTKNSETTSEQANNQTDTASVENCNTNEEIEFLGNMPKKSNFYIIGVAHTYQDKLSLSGYVYDNGGLVLKAFQKIHELQGSNNPLPLYAEGLTKGFAIDSSSRVILKKIIPPCVIDMGYTLAMGIDVRKSRNDARDYDQRVVKFSQIFTEYCEINILGPNQFNGHLKKEIPTEKLNWLRDEWYPKTIISDLDLERSILSKVNDPGIVICGMRHVVRMGLGGKLDWAIVAVEGGKKFLETQDQGLMSSRIMAEKYVCESVLGLPCFP